MLDDLKTCLLCRLEMIQKRQIVLVQGEEAVAQDQQVANEDNIDLELHL